MDPKCLFCKLVNEKPDTTIFETDKTLAFLDIDPLTKFHALVIPKHHGEKLVDIPDDFLSDLLPVAAKVARATGAENYNILQNNGTLAHQFVRHVHVHVIPKPSKDEGLNVEPWSSYKVRNNTELPKTELIDAATKLRQKL